MPNPVRAMYWALRKQGKSKQDALLLTRMHFDTFAQRKKKSGKSGGKRTSQKDFDAGYRALFGSDKSKPKVKFTKPSRW